MKVYKIYLFISKPDVKTMSSHTKIDAKQQALIPKFDARQNQEQKVKRKIA